MGPVLVPAFLDDGFVKSRTGFLRKNGKRGGEVKGD
jgi:hypothetical protein